MKIARISLHMVPLTSRTAYYMAVGPGLGVAPDATVLGDPVAVYQ